MDDFIEDDDEYYISGTVVQPQKYNIVLTRDGEDIEFDFPPATSEMIARFGYLAPKDERCTPDITFDEEGLYNILSPVLGANFRGDLSYHTRKQVIISLHGTAVLGYQRQTIIDPRIGNDIALFWEIYLDERVFPQVQEDDWCALMADIIIQEVDDDDADRKLAEDIKNRLLEQTL